MVMMYWLFLREQRNGVPPMSEKDAFLIAYLWLVPAVPARKGFQ